MKSPLDRIHTKTQQFQFIKLPSEAAAGAAKGESLFDQFSEVLDKIAARVNQRIQEAENQGAAFFDAFAIPVLRQPERMEASPKLRGEKPQENSQEENEPRESEVNFKAERAAPAGEKPERAAERGEEPASQTQGEKSPEGSDEAAHQSTGQNGQGQAEVAKVAEKKSTASKADGEGAQQEELPLSDDELAQLAESAEQQMQEQGDAAPKAVKAKDGDEVSSKVSGKVSGESAASASDEVLEGAPQIGAEVKHTPNQAGAERASEKKEAVAAEKNSSILSALLAANFLTGGSTGLERAQTIVSANIQQAIAAGNNNAVEGLTKALGNQGGGQGSGVLFGGQHGKASQEAQLEKQRAQLPPQLASRTFERVEAVLKEAAKSRDGKTISLRLDPPNLGTVKADVTIKDGVLHARLSADSSNVSNMLRERAHELQGALRRLGLNVERVTVAVTGEGEIPQDSFFNAAGDNSSAGFAEQHHAEQQGAWIPEFESGAAIPAAAVKEEIIDHWVA
ncbi:MAG: flagellar hook-length control protein FliK [Deltaproteobacteria bacterium]|nr:flagellar hook-length control protein FliK [Deltaproteobacteria bacterium]